ncbi:hypothetical protein H4582DRAFT_2060867 [Lactarius indigo]|nr:hypothetical protein H4582DRAFT_2214371 [Lactarius indigo]KAI9433670.1 hypothetical protein H4582DRAFT_2060867 [Lactarius indigo]
MEADALLSCSTPQRDRDRNYNQLQSSCCCWLGSLGAVHAKVDPFDTELVPIVVDTRLFMTRRRCQLPLECGGLFEGRGVRVPREGHVQRSPTLLFVLAGQRDGKVVLPERGAVLGSATRNAVRVGSETEKAHPSKVVAWYTLVLQSHIRASSAVSCPTHPGSIDRQLRRRGLTPPSTALVFAEEGFSLRQETRRHNLVEKREVFLGATSIDAAESSEGSRSDADEFRLVDETVWTGWDDPRPVLRDSMTRRPAAKRFE